MIWQSRNTKIVAKMPQNPNNEKVISKHKAIAMPEVRKNKYRAGHKEGDFDLIASLFDQFHTDFLSEKSGIEAKTLRSWKCRGRVSPFIATELCKIKEVKKAGFTREKLRPDVLVWFDEV